MTGRWIWASLTRRFRQLALIAAAVALAAGTVATLAGFAQRAEEGLDDELAAFGPNLVVRPQVGGPAVLPGGEAARLREIPGVLAAAGWIDLGPDDSGVPVLAVERSVLDVHPAWKLTGTWPEAGQALLGADVAAPGKAPAGATVTGELEITGTLDTGGELDRAVLVDATTIVDATAPAASSASSAGFHRIEVRTERGRLDEVAAAVASRVAGAEARPLRRVSLAEAGLIRRLTLLLAGVSAVAVALALISVIAATTALIEVRRTELGLLLALGCTERRVAGLFAVEVVAAALAAALAGAVAGELIARGMAVRLLGSELETATPVFTWSGPVFAALAALVVVGGSLAFAIRRSGNLDPARLLRGA